MPIRLFILLYMKTNFFSTLLTLLGRTPWRSLSLFLTVVVMIFTVFLFLFIERNARSAVTYYEYSPLDERRFTLSQDVDIFSLFARGRA
jgi:cell division protein FtsX